MMIVPMSLPLFCYNAERRFEPVAAVVHFLHIDPTSSDYATPPAEWQRFDVSSLFNLLVEMNHPLREWGPMLKPYPDADPKMRGYASYHTLIAQSGDDYELVPPEFLAYHAGLSLWNGRDDCNSWTWGVALAGPPFTDAQYASLAAWARCRNLGSDNLRGHDAVREAWRNANPHDRRINTPAATPKRDPGPTFDWGKLAQLLQ